MANIFKTTDSGGLVGVLRDFALAIRQFFGTKSEMDVVATALTDLDNRKIEASDIPTSLPANGGNADTVDGEHASAFAHIGAHNNLTASGNEFTFASNEFSGAIWFNYRTAGGANGNITEYKFGNGKGGELGTAIHSGNYNSYSPSLTGTGASGTWGINISGNAATASNVAWSGVANKPTSFTPSSHTHTKSEITDFPTSLPASDVYAWAKASTKPSYSWSEIDSRPTNVSAFTNDAGYITASNSKFGYYLPLSGGTITGQLYLTGLEEGSSDVTDNTELLTSYASNNGFSDTNATGKVYRRDAIKVYNYIKGKLDSVYSAIGHTHTTSQIMGFPTSLPANGGNADTVDGYHAADFVLKTTHDEHESVIAEALSDLDSRKVDIEDMPTSLPASDVYAWAKAANKPSYSFSEITPGVATIGDGANRMMFRTNASYKSGIYYSTPGNESMVFANINPVTSWIFAKTDPTANTDWRNLTPSLQIKNGSVSINKLIEDGANASYNLDVSGSTNATTLYEDGVRVSVSGHTHTKSEIIDFPNFIQNITIGNVITGAPGTDAIVDASVTGSDVVLYFTIPRGDKGEQGDMRHYHDKQTDSSGRVLAYYCAVNFQWGIKLKTALSYDYSTKMFLPIPSDIAMQSQADCISMDYEVDLNSGEGLFNQQYKWANLHWQLQCAKKGVSVYATRYSTSDSDFYFGIENSKKTPITDLTTVEILVRYGNGSTYIQANIENSYGRAYYRGSGFVTRPIQ